MALSLCKPPASISLFVSFCTIAFLIGGTASNKIDVPVNCGRSDGASSKFLLSADSIVATLNGTQWVTAISQSAVYCNASGSITKVYIALDSDTDSMPMHLYFGVSIAAGHWHFEYFEFWLLQGYSHTKGEAYSTASDWLAAGWRLDGKLNEGRYCSSMVMRFAWEWSVGGKVLFKNLRLAPHVDRPLTDEDYERCRLDTTSTSTMSTTASNFTTTEPTTTATEPTTTTATEPTTTTTESTASSKPSTTTTTVPSIAATASSAITVSEPSSSTAAAEPFSGMGAPIDEGGLRWWAILLIVLGALALVGLIGYVCYAYAQTRNGHSSYAS